MRVNEERSKKAIEYVNKNYSIKEFLVSKGLMSSDFEFGKIGCLEHEDKTFSMDVDIYNNRFKCHSCGASGNYVSMIVHYNEAILNKKSNYFKILDDIIKNDVVARAHLGFSTIFDEEKVEIKFGVRKFSKEPNLTYLMVSRKLKDFSVSEKLMAVNLAQKGMSPKEILNIISNGNKVLEDDKDIEMKEEFMNLFN